MLIAIIYPYVSSDIGASQPGFINACFTHNDMTETVSVIIMPKRKHSYRILFSAFRYYYAPSIFPNPLCPKINIEGNTRPFRWLKWMVGSTNSTPFTIYNHILRAIIGSNYNLSVRDCAHHLHQMPMQQTANRSKLRTYRTSQHPTFGGVYTSIPY